MKILAVILSSLMLTTAVVAQEPMTPEGEGSTFVLPDPGGETYEAIEEEEWTTDMDLFLKRGYRMPSWDSFGSYVDEIAADVAIPDYIERTGKPRPEYPSIDVAPVMLLGGDFNDLIVRSRLPGDCTENGCLVQIYSLADDVWVKRYEFRALEFAFRHNPDGTTSLALVGNEYVPSQVVTWNGSTFSQ